MSEKLVGNWCTVALQERVNELEAAVEAAAGASPEAAAELDLARQDAADMQARAAEATAQAQAAAQKLEAVRAAVEEAQGRAKALAQEKDALTRRFVADLACAALLPPQSSCCAPASAWRLPLLQVCQDPGQGEAGRRGVAGEAGAAGCRACGCARRCRRGRGAEAEAGPPGGGGI